MITKINKIKSLGIFTAYKWDNRIQNFGRYNLIYGWNGSGKTTLARLFACLQEGLEPRYPELEYEIETTDGVIKNGESASVKIRVFNRDYIQNNVYPPSGKSKPIYILGEENKKIIEEIALDETRLATQRINLKRLEEKIRKNVEQKEKLFSDIAKTIGLNTSGLATRTYRKPEAEKDFQKLSRPTFLNAAEVKLYSLELKQLEKPDVAELQVPHVSNVQNGQNILESLNMVVAEGKRLCSETIESQIIERFIEHPDIGQWVERGLNLHETHLSKKCEFCGRELPLERMRSLAAHFNVADKKIKNAIDRLVSLLTEVTRVIQEYRIPEKANLYEELQTNYQTASNKLEASKSMLLKQIDSIRNTLNEKKAKTTESVMFGTTLNASDFMGAIESVNTEIKIHNEKTKNFQSAKDIARKKLETHYLSTIYDEVSNLENTIAADESAVDNLKNGNEQTEGAIGISTLLSRIKENRAKVSSSHKGCAGINSGLKTFLGREELQFEVEEEGYILKRGNKIASDLSEGEKTAIGLVHFIINLKDEGFDKTKGIIVVDDPISSLDSNSIFQAFSFLKNSIKDANQVFILTHNFDFLRLIINWMSYTKGDRGYYMILNTANANCDRIATIRQLDPLIRDYESEYQFLFKQLYTFKDEGTIASVYNMPNIARKVLETFLMFRVPNSENSYKKLESLKTCYDENKLTAIYKFTNDQSHFTGKGFDPSLVAETQKNISYILNMIETVFPEHYNIMVKAITQ